MLKALHFGAGSLGRGLVVPVLAQAGWQVAVADADRDLIAALARHGSYLLEIVALDGTIHQEEVTIGGAYHIQAGRAALQDWLAEVALITTSVRVENLPEVCSFIAPHVRGRLADGKPPLIMPCENLEGGGAKVAGLLGLTGQTFCLDAEVDRNSQAAWPADLSVRTEAYLEWIAQMPPGLSLPVPGMGQVPDLEPYFYRKRYLVNTVADSLAFVGTLRGQRFLAESAGDPHIVTLLAPLFGELKTVLLRCFRFSQDDLDKYLHLALRRLSAPGINRRIETVARDGLRKLALGERFMRPVGQLASLGLPAPGLARGVAAVMLCTSASEPAGARGEAEATLETALAQWRGADWAEEFAALVRSELDTLPSLVKG